MDRRQFSKYAACGAGFAALQAGAPGQLAGLAVAAPSPLKLDIVSRIIDVDGKAAKVFGLVGPGGKSGLELIEGQDYGVDLANTLAEDTMIHWHGLTPKWEMDGVPDMPMPMLKPGEMRNFLLPSGKTGTHWMHAHTLQEQALLAAPLIVKPRGPARDEQEVVVLLHDFSFKSPEEILAALKSGGMAGMPAMNMKGMDHSKMNGMTMEGMNMPGMDQSKMPGMGGGMMGMDLNDIEYDAYLANDRPLNDPEVVKVEKGGKVRLRIINGATATAFSIDTGQLAGTIAAVDGQDVAPIAVPQFPLAMGQRVDVLVNIPKEGGAFPILALREGAPQRAGIVLATAGARVAKVNAAGDATGPILALGSEHMLRAASPLVEREHDRKFTVVLSGNMQGYTWSMTADQDISVKLGERIAIEMQNHSMMTHPMHLHGHHFQIVGIDGMSMAGALRDTVLVPPMASVRFVFDASNPGKGWAFHCHHLYHMATGMMTFVPYQS